MRPLIVTAFVSLDGVAQAPGPDGTHPNAGWTVNGVEMDPASYELKGTEHQEAGALLLGRRSYAMFAPVWPAMDDFAGYNAMPRYVVSTTLTDSDPGWPATVLGSLEEVAALKQSDGGPILVHGSLELGHALAAAGLVDRYHLLVFPVLLGEGQRLFNPGAHPMTRLQTVESQTYANGVQKLVLDILA